MKKIETLDERIRARAAVEWGNKVRDMEQAVRAFIPRAIMYDWMEIGDFQLKGDPQRPAITFDQFLTRFFDAVAKGGAVASGEEAVVSFLQRFDELSAEVDELRTRNDENE